MNTNVKEWLKAILTAGAISLILVQFIVPTTVNGISMEPSFEHKEYILLNRQAYLGSREPTRGEVVVFKSHLKDENGKDKSLIKRVIAVSGDRIYITDGKVYINGEELKEDYLKDGLTNGEIGPVTVPEGKLFCMGDNRLHSTDSRYLEVGFVDCSDIVGKAFFKVYPFRNLGMVRSPQ